MKFLDPYLGSWIWFSELATTCQTVQNADGSSAPLKVAPLNNSIQHSDRLLADSFHKLHKTWEAKTTCPTIIHTEKQS